MNLFFDVHLLGLLLLVLGAAQTLSLALAAGFGEPLEPYLVAVGCSVLAGSALAFSFRAHDRRLRARDGFFIVGGGWILASSFGAVPYVATGILGPVDAFFESVAGFTTTGSTVLTKIETVPKALLFWRALTQWLGGMGIILFTIAILPVIGVGGMELFRAEVPGPVADKIRPRIVETARMLWVLYLGFTAAEVLCLRLAGVDLFESICHAFTTMATGGFSTRDTSIGSFESPLVEWIVVFFMLAAGMNFVLHYRLLQGRFREVWKDAELRYFLAVVAVATVLVTATLAGELGWEKAFRQATFQVVSILTTTGYVTTDFEAWTPLAHFCFLLLMVLGGMSGSTGGGIKSMRALLGLRALKATLDRLVHPHAVRPVKYAGAPVPDEVLAGIWAFFTAYFVVAAFAAGCVAAAGYDLVTAASSALTALGNVGPGLGEVGAYDNFAHFPAAIKILLSLCMLAGRLEVFTLLVLCFPEFWRR
ncbi:MAG: Trk system potassium transporter TrkH [Candidatus Binatia bacterium]|nr:MAG: Trk system potassium transporter TrkH [Candidatus Binatia bacterium]